jgi:RNA polymerase sigma-70 factor (ECF subfamily)
MRNRDAVVALPPAGAAGWHPRSEEAALDDSRAMERFLAEVERRALRIAVLSVGDRDEALDIVQDAMFNLVRRYGGRPSEEWRPLFFRILANRITDQQRRQSVRQRVIAWFAPAAEDDDSDPIAELPNPQPVAPDQVLGRAEAMAALEAAVGRLPGRQRQAFLLRSLEGLDVAETAAAMGCSEGSVKTHYSRAVHSLRSALGDHWPGPTTIPAGAPAGKATRNSRRPLASCCAGAPRTSTRRPRRGSTGPGRRRSGKCRGPARLRPGSCPPCPRPPSAPWRWACG